MTMRQYNRIMLGEHGRYLQECLEGNFIGTNFLSTIDLSRTNISDEKEWRKDMVDQYLTLYPDRSVGTARNAIGFLWTVSFGLQKGDIILASNGEGGYRIGIIEGDYHYSANSNLPHRRPVKWLDNLISRKAMSKELQNSTGSIGTCCNVTKYSLEIDSLLNGVSGQQGEPVSAPEPRIGKYKERDLHRLLSHYLLSQKNILSKTIFHETAKKSDQNQKWIHPDMIGVSFSQFQDKATIALLKAADIKQYVDLYSFELKCSIQSDHQLKESFFQALSNSSWANFGYLVAFEISDDLMEEMERLNRAFGIGIIHLSSYDNDTKILFPARKNEVDYYTIDKLCRIHSGFKEFMERTTRMLNAQKDVHDDVKKGFLDFCDKGFSSYSEVMDYCKEKGVPV